MQILAPSKPLEHFLRVNSNFEHSVQCLSCPYLKLPAMIFILAQTASISNFHIYCSFHIKHHFHRIVHCCYMTVVVHYGLAESVHHPTLHQSSYLSPSCCWRSDFDMMVHDSEYNPQMFPCSGVMAIEMDMTCNSDGMMVADGDCTMVVYYDVSLLGDIF